MARSQSQSAVAYHSGNIFTADHDVIRTEAFIVSKAGMFTTLGTNDEVLDIARRHKLPTFDLQFRFIMPGIHDAHVHILAASLSALSNLKPGMNATMYNFAESLKSHVCAYGHTHTYGNWIVGDLYRIENFDREAPDGEFPETPVLLRGGAGHAMFMNTAALKRPG